MLGKLMKTEIKATARSYLPLFGVLLLFTLINKIFWSINGPGALISLPRGLAVMGYVLTMGAIVAMTLIVTIQRFRKNLLGDEGYLMFTLPVKTWQLTLSKLIPAIMWQFISCVLAVLTILILAFDPKSVRLFPEGIRVFLEDFTSVTGMNFFGFCLELLVFLFFCACFYVLVIYTSIAIGHLFVSHRTLWSFGAFIGINIVLQTLATIVGTILSHTNGINLDFSVPVEIHLMMWTGSLIMLALSFGFFAATNGILSKRLNLE